MNLAGSRFALACLAALTLVFLAPASHASGQLLRGRVVDAVSGRPVSLSLVSLRDSSGSVVSSEESDWDGAFVIRMPEPGPWHLRVRHHAYEVHSSGAYAGARDTTVTITLQPVPVRLEGIEVESRGLAAIHRDSYDGLYLRRADPFYAAQVGPNRVFVKSDLVTDHGYTVRRFIELRTPPRMAQRIRQGCLPTVFWNAMGVSRPRAAILMEYSVTWLEGIEFYHASDQAPMSYRDEVGPCGAVVLWPLRP